MAEARIARSLRRNVGSAMAGNLVYTLSQFVMLLAVVRLTDEETVGRYALALALTAPVFIFFGLKMRHVQVTDATGTNSPGDYIGMRLVTSLGAFVACVPAALVVTREPSYLLLLLAVAGFKAAEAQVDIIYGLMQRRERLDLVGRSMVLRGLIGAGVFAGTLKVSESVIWSVFSLTVVTLFFVILDSGAVRSLGVSTRPEFNLVRLSRLAWLAFPLGISVAVGSLTTNMPRYLLEWLEGTAAVGVFATIAYVLVGTALVGGSAAEAAAPRLANLYAQRDLREFRRVVNKLCAFGLALGVFGTVVAWAVGEPVLSIVFGDAYGAESSVLVVLMLAATMQYVCLGVGAALYAMRQFRIQVPINILALLVAAAAGYLLVLDHGLEGAAWSVVATQSVLALAYALLYVLFVRRTIPRSEA